MNTRLLAAVVLAIGPPLWASGALAAQITFGPSAQSITFTGNGANSVKQSPAPLGRRLVKAEWVRVPRQ